MLNESRLRDLRYKAETKAPITNEEIIELLELIWELTGDLQNLPG